MSNVFKFDRKTDRLPLTFVLLIANVVVFLLEESPAAGNALVLWMALWPRGTPDSIETLRGLAEVPQFYPWQLITYGFLHGSLTHLFFNMLALYMFGLQLERFWGSQRFALYYFVCLAGAGLMQLLIASSNNEIYPTLGASGAVFGLLLAYGVTWPNNRIMLLFPPIPMKAKWFVIIFGAIELFMGVTDQMPGIAHFAHIGGMLFGAAVLYKWGWRPFRSRF